VLAAFLFDISVVLFRTGSMSPTIPAGSAALVREVPVDEVEVGDVVTVERDAALPITHRIVRIETRDGARELVLRGDANDADDPIPYRVSTVRVVLGSVPGIAPVIPAMGSPVVLGPLTLAATGLVFWAFWPRRIIKRSRPTGRAQAPCRRAQAPCRRAQAPCRRAQAPCRRHADLRLARSASDEH